MFREPYVGPRIEVPSSQSPRPLYLDRRVPGSADDDLVVHVDAPDVVGVAHQLPNQLASPAVVNLDCLVQLETILKGLF